MMMQREWCKLSSNDKHTLRELAIVLDARKVHYNYSYDNENYPPTIFAYMERTKFDDLLASLFGIHRR